MEHFEVHECFAARVRKLSRKLDNRYRILTKEFGISENQLNILFYLDVQKEVEQGVMAKDLVLERSTISRNLKVLEKLRLVTRSNDYHPVVTITAEGQKMVNEIVPKWNVLMNELEDCLGEEGVSSLKTLEGKIN